MVSHEHISIALIKLACKNIGIIFDNFGWHVIALSSFWSVWRYYFLTNIFYSNWFKGNAIRGVPRLLYFKKIRCWEKCSMVLRTRLPLKPNNMGLLILWVSSIFSKWTLNFLTASFSFVISSPSTKVILSFLRALSAKFGLIVC